MGYERWAGMNAKRNYKTEEPQETLAEVSKYVTADGSDRGIRKEVMEKFGIKMALSEQDRSIAAIYFPYYNQQGKLTGYKKRDLTKDKYETGHFTVIGTVGVHSKLFGQQEAEAVTRARKKLLFVEGEWDVLAAYQAALDTAEAKGYKGLEPHVVGLSCGCGNAKAAATVNEQFLNAFPTVVLGFDADEASPDEARRHIKKGKEATEDIGILLSKQEVLVADYKEYHDPSDYVRAGAGELLAKRLVWAERKFLADKIVTAENLSFEELIKPRLPGVNLKQFPRLMEMTGGPRLRELWLFTAPSGAGKSTVTASIAADCREQGHRVGMIFLEEELKETILRMVAHKVEVNYNVLKFDPAAHAPSEVLQAAFDWVKEDDMFVFLDHFGSLLLETLMNKVKYLVGVYGVEYIVLDHLSMMVSGIETSDERKMLDMVMTELAAYVASHDVCIIAVSHLNRNVATEFKPPKGKEDEPFFVNVRKEDLRGSASLEQLSWVIVGVEPEIMPDKSRGRIRLVVLKNRPWGTLGHADYLIMNLRTGILEDASGF